MISSTMQRKGDLAVFVSLQELLTLKSHAKQFSLSSFKVKSARSGQRVCRLLARGMEFAESRRYLPGDDVRNIDWRVTARTGKAHTKLFAVEKERQVILVADMRSPMYFATKGVFKSVQTALMMGCLGWNACESGDRLGGLIIDDEGFFECKPALGKKSLFPFFQAIAERNSSHKINQENLLKNKSASMDLAIENLKRIATPGSLVFIVSDFRHFSEKVQDLIVQISRHSDICLCFIYDPLEADFPKKGQYAITDGTKNIELNVQAMRNMERYRKQFIERRNKAASLDKHRHIYFMECSTEDDCLDVLRNAFNKKR